MNTIFVKVPLLPSLSQATGVDDDLSVVLPYDPVKSSLPDS